MYSRWSRLGRRGVWWALVAQAWVLCAAGVSVLLCGGMPQGSMGVFFLCASAALVLVAPGGRVPAPAWIGAGLVVGSGFLALLPAGVLPETAWRKALVADGGFPALGRVSVVPEETLLWLAILGGTLMIGLYLVSQPASGAARLWLAAAAAAFCAVYAGMAMFAQASGWQPAFDAGPSFGFFANRNHVATLLATGAIAGIGVLACGIERRAYWAAITGALAAAVCCWAVLLESPSRGGVFALVIGAGIWLAGLGRGRMTLPVLVTAAALVAAAVVYFWGTDNPASQRLLGVSGAAPVANLTTDFRLKVYRDSLRMLGDFPWTGSGLGTYRFLYPWYADASLVESTALHPESDWLMAAIESGPLAIAGFAVLLVSAGLRAFSLRKYPDWTVRWALVCAAFAALLHGAMDVPLHRVELGWWVAVLACLGLARGKKEENGSEIWRHLPFFVAGIFLALLGASMIAAQWFGGKPLPPFAPKSASEEILAKFNHGKPEDALYLAMDASDRWPMDGDLRYQLGVLAMGFVETDAAADAAFRAARLLNPKWPRIPLEQGNAWYPLDPRRAAPLWLEAVERRAAIDRRGGETGAAGLGTYTEILTRLRGDPATLRLLMPPDSFAPALHFAWVRVAPEVGMRITELASTPAFRDALTPEQRAAFLSLWRSRGDTRALEAFLQANPSWEADAWASRLKACLANADHRGATEILCARFGVSLKKAAPEDGGLPQEYADLLASRNNVAARRVLEDAVKAGGPRAAAAFKIRASNAAQIGDWRAAYAELLQYLKATGRDPSPYL